MASGIINGPCLMLKPNISIKFTPRVHTPWGRWSDLENVHSVVRGQDARGADGTRVETVGLAGDRAGVGAIMKHTILFPIL